MITQLGKELRYIRLENMEIVFDDYEYEDE
jgi:hypothetical protein